MKRSVRLVYYFLFVLCVTSTVMATSIYAQPEANPLKKAQQIESLVRAAEEIIDLILIQHILTPPKTDMLFLRQKVNKNLTLLLNQEFTEKEIHQLTSIREKIGKGNLKKLTKKMFEEFKVVLDPKTALKDFDLKIPRKMNAELDIKLMNGKAMERFKDHYISVHIKKYLPKPAEKAPLEKDATRYAIVAVKYIKRAISEVFTEEQYFAYQEFKASKLGDKYRHVIRESLKRTLMRNYEFKHFDMLP